jgi:cell wall-associated NlpC family hydrolase
MTPRLPTLLVLMALSQMASAEPQTEGPASASTGVSASAAGNIPAAAMVPPAAGSGASINTPAVSSTSVGTATNEAPPSGPSTVAGKELAAIGQQSLRVVDWAATRTQDLLATALSSIGVKYKRGASDPTVGFDCSGFVMHVYKEALGLLLPHNAYSMSLQGKPVTLANLKPGDLVFFNTLKRQFSHVGIYLGDDRFIHAPSHGKSVQVDKLSDSYWVRHFNGARHIDGGADAALAAGASTPTPQE